MFFSFTQKWLIMFLSFFFFLLELFILCVRVFYLHVSLGIKCLQRPEGGVRTLDLE